MSNDARAEFAAIGSALAAVAPVAASKMFGMPCLKVEGKAFAGLYGEAMVFKLGADSRPGALALPWPTAPPSALAPAPLGQIQGRLPALPPLEPAVGTGGRTRQPAP